MRITRRRAQAHIRRQSRVRKNCRYLSPDSKWKPFKAGWDRGAFKEEGRTLYITCDGSSRVVEWISNARVFERRGFHRGFQRAAEKGLKDLKKRLNHPIAYYKEVIWDVHSRGVFGLIMGCYIWADVIGLDWENVSFDLLISQYRKFEHQFTNRPPIQSAVASGIPVFCDMPVLYEYENMRSQIIDIHFLETEKDFIPDINVPERGLFSRTLKGRRLYHLPFTKYNLGTARRQIDHIGYEQAIDGAPDSMWG